MKFIDIPFDLKLNFTNTFALIPVYLSDISILTMSDYCNPSLLGPVAGVGFLATGMPILPSQAVDFSIALPRAIVRLLIMPTSISKCKLSCVVGSRTVNRDLTL